MQVLLNASVFKKEKEKKRKTCTPTINYMWLILQTRLDENENKVTCRIKLKDKVVKYMCIIYILERFSYYFKSN